MAEMTTESKRENIPPIARKEGGGVGSPAPAVTTTILGIEDDTSHAAYGSLYIVGGIMVGGAICANVWQVVTSTLAWGVKIVQNPQYQKMNLPGMFGSTLVVGLISFMIAIFAQLGMINAVFQIKGSFIRNAQGVSTGDTIKHTAVEIINQPVLVLLWIGLGVLVDTVGDATFIGLYTKDTLVMFVYMGLLYAGATVMLRSGLKKLFAASISHEKHKFWRDAMKKSIGSSTSK